jgi:hypothetical protein
MLVCLIPAIVLFLNRLVLKNSKANLWFKHWFKQEVSLNANELLFSIIGPMIALPYMLKLAMDALIIFQSFYAVWDVNLVPA